MIATKLHACQRCTRTLPSPGAWHRCQRRGSVARVLKPTGFVQTAAPSTTVSRESLEALARMFNSR